VGRGRLVPCYGWRCGGTIAAAVAVIFDPSVPAQWTLVAVLIVLALTLGAVAKSANISGVIFTLDSSHLQTCDPTHGLR